ncbi:MAG: peptidoglycan editing factor PgeF [Candidatus Obscuribacterales bacterium]|nr:peptidoglycan editing factor PgeF [Candidatus Obscuribacterales bacterium]
MKYTSGISQTALRTNSWIVQERDGIRLVLSPRLMELDFVNHAFTTRIGGNSRAPFDSFNLGGQLKEDELKLDAHANRKQLCKALSINYQDLVVPGQVHSRNVELVEGNGELPDLKAVDGLITSRPATPLLLHFADCVPVIVVEKKSRLIGIFHAGWRGTAAGIVRHGVEQMVSLLGADPAHMVGAIGPAIGSCCYPTSGEVIEALKATVSEIDGLISEHKSGQQAPELKAINAMQLLEAGVHEVDVSDYCTACNPDVFYSHRQSGGSTGRQGALVCIK